MNHSENKSNRSDDYILEVRNLKKYFPVNAGFLRKNKEFLKAVDGVSFQVRRGETLGLVGESGCGKSTTGNLILRLLEATEGEVLFEGKNILTMKRKELRQIRKNIQVIFQDPYSSLNPRMTAEEIIGEPIEYHGIAKGPEKEKRVKQLFELVGLSTHHMRRYPHEFSGGQRQRIGIARALAVNPKLIICDEPVSALDVSIQAQILNLLVDLQKEFGITYIFIAHGLPAVKYISNRIAVMYLGKIVEMGDSDEICRNPRHPYTQALMSAVPNPNPAKRSNRIILEGDVPSPINPPKGCRFCSRCPYVMPVCKEQEPVFQKVGEDNYIACHLVDQSEGA